MQREVGKELGAIAEEREPHEKADYILHIQEELTYDEPKIMATFIKDYTLFEEMETHRRPHIPKLQWVMRMNKTLGKMNNVLEKEVQKKTSNIQEHHFVIHVGRLQQWSYMAKNL